MLWAAVVSACATGGNQGDDAQHDASVGGKVDAAKPIDSSQQQVVDSSIPIDAFVPPLDAFVPADASTMGGFCQANTDCTTTGECCFVALCVPGTAIGTVCLPN